MPRVESYLELIYDYTATYPNRSDTLFHFGRPERDSSIVSKYKDEFKKIVSGLETRGYICQTAKISEGQVVLFRVGEKMDSTEEDFHPISADRLVFVLKLIVNDQFSIGEVIIKSPIKRAYTLNKDMKFNANETAYREQSVVFIDL